MHSKLKVYNLENELKKLDKYQFFSKIIDESTQQFKIDSDYSAFFLMAPIKEELNPLFLTGELNELCSSLKSLDKYDIIQGNKKNGIYFFPSIVSFSKTNFEVPTKSSILKRYDTITEWLNIIMYPNIELLKQTKNSSLIEYSMYLRDMQKITKINQNT